MSIARLVPHAIAAALLLGSALGAHAADLSVPMDEVRVIKFKTPVATVYVGNPAIADVTVIDPTHVFLLGKSYGKTNLIALDINRNPIVNDQVTGVRAQRRHGHAQPRFEPAHLFLRGRTLPGRADAGRRHRRLQRRGRSGCQASRQQHQGGEQPIAPPRGDGE